MLLRPTETRAPLMNCRDDTRALGGVVAIEATDNCRVVHASVRRGQGSKLSNGLLLLGRRVLSETIDKWLEKRRNHMVPVGEIEESKHMAGDRFPDLVGLLHWTVPRSRTAHHLHNTQ